MTCPYKVGLGLQGPGWLGLGLTCLGRLGLGLTCLACLGAPIFVSQRYYFYNYYYGFFETSKNYNSNAIKALYVDARFMQLCMIEFHAA